MYSPTTSAGFVNVGRKLCAASDSCFLGTTASSAVSCHASGAIVDTVIDMPSGKPNILQAGRAVVRNMGGADDHPSRLTDNEL